MAESVLGTAFSASDFRRAIHATMKMGMPPDVADQLTWHWDRTQEFSPQDRADRPYDWTRPPVVDLPGNPQETDGALVVDYAIEFQPRTISDETAFGEFNIPRAVVTLLDVDYELVKTADFCTLSNATYDVQFVAPVVGLFEVAVHSVHIRARDA